MKCEIFECLRSLIANLLQNAYTFTFNKFQYYNTSGWQPRISDLESARQYAFNNFLNPSIITLS